MHPGVVEHINRPGTDCSCEWGFARPRGLADIAKDQGVCPGRGGGAGD